MHDYLLRRSSPTFSSVILGLFVTAITTAIGYAEGKPDFLILGAIPPEIAPITDALEDKTLGAIAGFPVWRGRLYGHHVIVAQTGVGKTNTGMVTGVLLQHFQPRAAIMTGT